MQLEQHLDGFREAVDAFAASATTAGSGPPYRPPRLGRTPPGRPPGTGPPLGDRRTCSGEQVDPRRRRAGGAGGRRSGRLAPRRAPIGCSPRSRRPPTTSKRWSSSPTPRRRSGSGRDASATRPPSMRSTRCRRSLGRYPRAADTWIDPRVALDGIDELAHRLPAPAALPAPGRGPDDDRRDPRGRRPALAGRDQQPAAGDGARTRRRGRRRGPAAAPRSRSTSPCGTAATRSSDERLDLWAEGARVTWG